MRLSQQPKPLNETQYTDKYQQSSDIAMDQHGNYVYENVSMCENVFFYHHFAFLDPFRTFNWS